MKHKIHYSTAKLLAAAATILAPVSLFAFGNIPSNLQPSVIVSTEKEPLVPGKFAPTWQSLSQYETPEWFRDAKFGIWAHWGPQCQPEAGDWYAREMYLDGSDKNKFHLAHYGSPADHGFKEVIRDWRAKSWDPRKLVALYKRAGAKYFFALANHHDNFDLWDSKYQPWNSVAVGPKKNLIGGWAAAAREQGLRLGLSVHASHAWLWYEASQKYDGNLTKADGKGKWWNGLDPKDLYAQGHEPSRDYLKSSAIIGEWDWGNGASKPDAAYCERFYNRTMDLIKKYRPDLIYFDDNALPLWPVSDAGLKLAANFYNLTAEKNGANQGVIFGKFLTPDQIQCMTHDFERGGSHQIETRPWQTDTCLGDWHYKREVYDKNGYKSAKTVIHTLADVVSKNGNLLLNVPVRGDGTIDEKELAVVQGIGDWMQVNQEAIFATRPWKVYGEGPATSDPTQKSGGFTEGKGKAFTADDARFTTSKDGKTLYAILLGWPDKPVTISSLGKQAGLLKSPITSVSLLGDKWKAVWELKENGLVIQPPPAKQGDVATAAVYKISLAASE
ncbi:MAG: alpha-L-fucosidase [Verrucomicrobiota bacterium]